MKKYDVVIIGGGPAGVTCALSAKNTYPNKEIALVRQESVPMIPCGIPYILHTLAKVEDNILPDTSLNSNNINVIQGEVIGADGKKIILANNEEVEFDRLVIATGSKAVLPNIEGISRKGIYLIKKESEYLRGLKVKVHNSTKIVILGGGYIGIEVADEITKSGKDLTIVEMADTLLPSMDPEFGMIVKDKLSQQGAKVITGKSVEKVLGDVCVSGVELDDGSKIDCDLLIVSIGYKPNTSIAEKFGVRFEEGKGILVDDYLRTSEKDIFAIGDCAAKYDYFTGEFCNIMLASTAMAEGRMVGTNLFSIKIIRQYQGVLGTFSTKIGDTAFATTGINERRGTKRNLDYTIGIAKALDRHPGKLPGAKETYMKLLFSTYSHTLLGAQIYGGDSIGEMINILAVMILNKMTDIDIVSVQIGTHPLLTASPVVYPIISATADAIKKWNLSIKN